MGLFKFLKEIIYGKNTEKLKYAIQHYPYLKHNLDEAIFSIFLSSIIKIKLVYYLINNTNNNKPYVEKIIIIENNKNGSKYFSKILNKEVLINLTDNIFGPNREYTSEQLEELDNLLNNNSNYFLLLQEKVIGTIHEILLKL